MQETPESRPPAHMGRPTTPEGLKPALREETDAAWMLAFGSPRLLPKMGLLLAADAPMDTVAQAREVHALLQRVHTACALGHVTYVQGRPSSACRFPFAQVAKWEEVPNKPLLDVLIKLFDASGPSVEVELTIGFFPGADGTRTHLVHVVRSITERAAEQPEEAQVPDGS